MNAFETGVWGTVAAAALALIWLSSLRIAYLQGNRASESPPGVRRRLLGALLGLTSAPLPLLVWAVKIDDETGLALAGALVVTQQLAGGLTFSGALAAWRIADLVEPPPAPPAAEDAAATGR